MKTSALPAKGLQPATREAPELQAAATHQSSAAMAQIDKAASATRADAARAVDQTDALRPLLAANQDAVAVDAVSDVLGVPEAALQPAPLPEAGAPLLDRVAVQRGGSTILLVSAATLLQAAERDILAAWAAAA